MRNQYTMAKGHAINEWVELRQRITKLQKSEIQVEQMGEEIKKLNGKKERPINHIGQLIKRDQRERRPKLSPEVEEILWKIMAKDFGKA